MHIKWDLVLFLLGGVFYALIEVVWRGYTHWSMLVLGGTVFLTLYKLFNKLDKFSLLEKCVIGAGIITMLEFITGCIVNIYFDMGVWNYSRMPFNLLGQVCILYSTMWGFLCIPINYLSGKIRKIAVVQ